ncbi:lysostaphin resistance A-like protein [Brachybacterium sp. AOP42-B2-9]|uniref:lysostaphin resistance A-like protein n=1 Tax=Brachybacterium sp. AOP42-B2-9 TaxID=3457672 RepID=UPI004034DE2C
MTAQLPAPAPPSSAVTPPLADRARADHPAVIGVLSGIFVTAIVVTALRSPQGVVVSADPGYVPMAVPLLLVPAGLAIVLALLLPAGSGDSSAIVRRQPRAATESAGLIGLAAGFLLLVPVLPLPEDYVLLKFAMFLLIPGLVLGVGKRRRGSSVRIPRPQVPRWVLILPVLVLGVLSSIGPFSPGMPSSWPPLPMLIIAATATAVTAGIGEEVLFRRLLQTRLEALAGPWTGILAASLLFGLMHVFSHGDGPLWVNAAQVIALQGTTGIALGVIWSRWRRLWPCVLAHILLNGFAVLLHLLSLLG